MSFRVLLAVHGYPPSGRGGAERRAARTARGLTRRGVAACVLAYDGGAESGRHARVDAPVEWTDTIEDGVRVRRMRGDLLRGQEPWLAAFDNDATGRAVDAAIAEWRPDLVHLVSGYLMSASVVGAARHAGLPVVVSLTDYWWLCHRITLLTSSGRRCDGPTLQGCTRCALEARRRWRLPSRVWPAGADAVWRMAGRLPAVGAEAARQRHRAATLRDALSGVDALIAPSRYLADVYVRAGADASRMHVHRQGVEAPAAPAREVSSRLRVSYAGQIKAHKGVDLLLSAWSRLSGPRPRSLRLFGSAIGEDAYRQRIESMLAGLPDASWSGEYQADSAWEMLAATDVLVVPSRWVENSPNIMLEAQAMRVPVVGSNLGGIAELVAHDRDGLLFDVDNAGDLARQLQRLLDDPGLQPRLSDAAPPVRSVEQELDDLLAVYDALTSGRPAR